MRKHRSRANRKVSVLRDANTTLSESTSERIVQLFAEFDDRGDFATRYLLDQFLSKYCDESLTPSRVRRQKAIDKFLETERRNRHTNSRLRAIPRDYNILPRVSWYSFLRFVQQCISKVLGPLDDSVVIGSFSGGATTSRRRTQSHPARKYVGLADVTREASQFVELVHRQAPLLREHGIFYNLREVEGNVLFTVPKKTDIDRCACKEPDVNMFLQKGVGNHIRRRLRKFGIDLNDQSRNRDLAQLGSRDSSLATLDLSSASDTITTSCVLALLPLDWFLYLNDIRSQSVCIDGTFVRTEMFSSMGNGFTFELESLIFWALMRAVAYFRGVPGVISVYGDDIIIPSEMYDYATWTLSVFGFTVNLSKSFSTGPFRESCGGHFHNGNDVTPFYLKRKPTRLTDVIRLANQLRRWALTDLRSYGDPRIFLLWKSLRDLVPQGLWGGYDLSLDTQLVSPHIPKHRLVRISGNEELPPLGSYLLWHNSNWNRSDPPSDEGRDPVRTSNKCRLRRANSGALVNVEEFHEELFPVTSPT